MSGELRNHLIDWLNSQDNPLDKLAEYDIRVATDARYPNLYNLKYGSIMADKSLPLVRACRGAVVEHRPNTGQFSLVAYAFDRFFNIGEPGCHELDWANTQVFEKYDGCLHSGTLIDTNHGKKTIKEICNNPCNFSVYGFDHETGRIIEQPIEAVSVNPVTNKSQWYKITLESGATITLTGNHRLWDEASKSYVRVDEMTGEEVLKEFK